MPYTTRIAALIAALFPDFESLIVKGLGQLMDRNGTMERA